MSPLTRVIMSFRVLAPAALALLIVGCSKGGSGSGSSSPTAPGETQAGGGSPVVMRITAAAAFSVTFQNQTITTSGLYTFNNLQNGTYTVSGQFANRLSFNMGTPNPPGQGHYDGQVQHAITIVTGPALLSTDCGPTFVDTSPSGTAGGNIAFSFQFTVAPSSSFSATNPPCSPPS